MRTVLLVLGALLGLITTTSFSPVQEQEGVIGQCSFAFVAVRYEAEDTVYLGIAVPKVMDRDSLYVPYWPEVIICSITETVFYAPADSSKSGGG